jgi:hypothetical protein
MKGRRPFAINGRRTAVKAFEAAFIRFPKSPTDRQTAFSHARAGRQNSEGFGGGNRVKK